jgi:uncharacterized membrane protein|tara:strand:+ start:150 stop:365 length:216 start_codon:yes stop_codon:yes gene_type:complete
MIRRKLDKLTKQVESAVDNLEKMSEQLKDLQDTMVKLWRAEDMEENDGEFRYPFDKHGNLLPNTDISRRLN